MKYPPTPTTMATVVTANESPGDLEGGQARLKALAESAVCEISLTKLYHAAL